MGITPACRAYKEEIAGQLPGFVVVSIACFAPPPDSGITEIGTELASMREFEAEYGRGPPKPGDTTGGVLKPAVHRASARLSGEAPAADAAGGGAKPQ